MLIAHRAQGGFSLIELALGLVIVATLLTALLVPLATQLTQRRTNETVTLLEQAREAILGFAIGNGRLPCPATSTSNGAEALDNTLNGTCTTQRGFLPAVTLALSPIDSAGFQQDGFGGELNRIRYAVSSATDPDEVTKRLFTAPGELTLSNLNAATKIVTSVAGNFTVCSAHTAVSNTECPPLAITLARQKAIAVVFSVGPSAAARGPSLDEAENLDLEPANRIIVSRDYSERPGSEFDDVVLWISPHLLVSRLVAAGRL